MIWAGTKGLLRQRRLFAFKEIALTFTDYTYTHGVGNIQMNKIKKKSKPMVYCEICKHWVPDFEKHKRKRHNSREEYSIEMKGGEENAN